jgi:outer membrane protein OmpA-like peptidoglycan-associated protein
MKIKDILLLSVILFPLGNITAQQIQNNVFVKDATAKRTNSGQVVIDMKIDGSKAELSSHEAVVITPVLRTGDHSLELQSVIVNGNNRFKIVERRLFFGERDPYGLKDSYVSLTRMNADIIGYTQRVPYQEWMEAAHLDMKQQIYGCADCKGVENWNTLLSLDLRKPEIKKPQIKYAVSYIVPKAEAVKNRNEAGSAYLDFPVGKSVILSDFRNNFKELSKILEAINQLKDNKDATISSITLKGFASPEGTYELNTRLSEARAQALRVYLQTQFSHLGNVITASSVPEDWVGLRKQIAESNLSDKANLLEIIDSGISEDAKEQKIKAMPVYKTLLDNYFPLLRRVEYRLNYVVRAFSVEEGKEIVKVRPGQMSLNEMFLVANTYEKGSEDFNNIFDIAVRLFPQDVVANLNASAIELDKQDLRSAHKYLDKYQDVPDSWNNQGILYALEGNLSKAREFFNSAKERGSQEAVGNLEKLKQYESYEKAVKEQSEK